MVRRDPILRLSFAGRIEVRRGIVWVSSEESDSALSSELLGIGAADAEVTVLAGPRWRHTSSQGVRATLPICHSGVC